MPTFMDALRHGRKVAIDVELTPSEWVTGRKAVLGVIQAFYELPQVTRWDEAPSVLFVPRSGTKFCLILRFRHGIQAVYLKAMLYRVASDHGWAFEDGY
jgi:hypothetical protein